MLNKAANSLTVLPTILHIALCVSNVELALHLIELVCNSSAFLGHSCGLANTLLTKQITLRYGIAGHSGLALNKGDVRFGHAFLASNVQHVLVCQELRHWVYGFFAGFLRLQICLPGC